MADNGLNIKKIAMIGCGSMGGGMAQLFAEQGIHVSLSDPSDQAMDAVIRAAKASKISEGMISKHANYEDLCKSLDNPKVFFWSLPHGSVGDSVLAGLMPYLQKGDIVIDCGNEHWENTQRRQGKCVTKGIRYVGCGVSGGYQAARRGPSMCPASDDETLTLVLPTLREVAAKDAEGNPCVGRVGTGGAGHYCKMIHNGIEHGMMSAIAEAVGIMRTGLGMNLDEMGDEFDRWNESGYLKGTFLVWTASDICRTEDLENGERVLDTVEDKVVQDYTGEEGTGVWSNTEALELHVPAPTLTVAHYLRLASGDRHQRAIIQRAFGVGSGDAKDDHTAVYPPQRLPRVADRAAFLESLRLAVYTTFLTAYCQGLAIISEADRTNHFNIDFSELLQVWKAGCIIQADYINDYVLNPVYSRMKLSKTLRVANPMYHSEVADSLQKGLPHLRQVVSKAVESDAVVPALTATLEYLKYQTSTDLVPTSFYEAQLDYFGHHMFDKKGDDPDGKPETGKHHFEWKPA